MNSFRPILVLLLVALALCALAADVPTALAAGPGLTGTVTNMASGAPIAGARLGVDDNWVVTDADGRYALSLLPGTYDVRIEAPGYIGMTERYQRVAEGDAVPLDVEMMPNDPTPEEAEAIEARMLAATA